MGQALMVEPLDCAVIGGGVVGLAVARRLAIAGRRVFLFEAERATGMHTSSRNSEVMHAGIYYPSGSLKARLCVAGRRVLEEYCRKREVAHRRIGKIIVAVHQAEIACLERHKAQAEANGVDDMRWMEPSQVRDLEPAVLCTLALMSPSTGIIDSHGLMAALAADARAAGAEIVLASPVLGGAVEDAGIALEIGGRDPGCFRFRSVVNAAGLFAPDVARTLRGVPAAAVPTAHYARGHYFMLSGPAPFRRLVYPLPEAGGLGIHVTLDLAGAVRFGPDVTQAAGVDYRFDEGRADAFYRAIRAYYPALRDGALLPGFVGVRPKLTAGPDFVDFVLQGPQVHGVPGLVNLFGIDSPGLTSCLAIADEVANLLI